MEENLEKLKKALQEALVKEEIMVDEVTYKHESNNNFLTIVLDKLGGIDLDTIVKATHIIDPIVSNMDLIKDSYILDVISKERG